MNDNQEVTDDGGSDQEDMEDGYGDDTGPVGLSKSWSLVHAHVPIYTGGRLRFLPGSGEGDDYMMTPNDGDVSISRAASGIQVSTVRNKQLDATASNDDEDDDEGYDPDTITAYAISGSTTLMICSYNSILKQYAIQQDPATPPQLVKVWGSSGHSLPVTHMEFHGAYLATASVDGTVRIWDARRAVLTHVLRGPEKVTALQWKATDTAALVLAIGYATGGLVVHDLLHSTDRNETIVATLEDHESAVTAIAWMQDSWMVSGGRDSVLNLWDSRSFQKLHTLAVMEQIEGLVAWKLPSARSVLATAGSKGIVRLWSVSSHQRLLRIGQQEEVDRFGAVRGGYLQLVVRPETNQLAVADAEHNVMYLSITETKKDGNVLQTDQTLVGNNDEILDLKLFPDSKHCVVATNSPLVRIFDTSTFSCQVLDGHTDTVLCVDTSPCGRLIATCGKDKTMRLWSFNNDTSEHACVAVAEGHTEAVGATALSRKTGKYQVGGKAARNGGGAFALTVSADRTLKRWNLSSIEELCDGETTALQASRSTQAHEKDINVVSVAPNDSLIATGSQDKTARLWKATDLSLVATLKGHRRGVWDCQFSPHDRVMATGSGDKTIKLWSLADHACVRTFQGHVATVLRLQFITSGLQLISSAADGLLKVWTVRTNECETTMDLHTGKVWAMDVSADGKRVVSGGGDARLVVWKDTTVESDHALRAEQEETILIDQQLANLLRHKEYKKALNIALEREKPFNALKILEKIHEQDIKEGKRTLSTLQTIIGFWPMERVVRILRYARDWNTRARNCHIAMLVVQAIVTSIPAHRLIAEEEVPEIVAGIIPYAERHFSRLDSLHSSSYLVNFVLTTMGALEDDDGETHDFNKWASSAQKRLVVPPKQNEGRADVGVQLSDEEYDSDAVVTVGYSSDGSE